MANIEHLYFSLLLFLMSLYLKMYLFFQVLDFIRLELGGDKKSDC